MRREHILKRFFIFLLYRRWAIEPTTCFGFSGGSLEILTVFVSISEARVRIPTIFLS